MSSFVGEYISLIPQKDQHVNDGMTIQIECLVELSLARLQRTSTRDNAILCCLHVGMLWDRLRISGGGSDRDIIGENILPDYAAYTEEANEILKSVYATDEKFTRDIALIYGLNSFARHPNPETYEKYPYYFDQIWPDEIYQLIIEAANTVCTISSICTTDCGWDAG